MRIFKWLNKLFGRSDIYFGDDLYMRRWRIGHRFRWSLRIHHIVRSDRDRELHDHPFDFVSLILWGGYVEITPTRFTDPEGTPNHRRWYGPGSIIRRKAENLHRLELKRPAWTLVLRGPIRREWGFVTTMGWVPWQDFVKLREARNDYESQYRSQYKSEASI